LRACFRTPDREPFFTANQSSEVVIVAAVEAEHLLDVGMIIRFGPSLYDMPPVAVGATDFIAWA
jgi:hypothetical protein